MLKEHPTIDELERFFRSASPCSLNVVRHLLAGCATCCERLKAAGWNGQRLERYMRLAATETHDPGYSYGKSFAAAERRLASFFASEAPLQESVENLLAELLTLPDGEQIRMVGDLRFTHPEVVRTLIHRGYAVRYEDPAKMHHLVYLARVAAQACTPAAAGSPERLQDLQ